MFKGGDKYTELLKAGTAKGTVTRDAAAGAVGGRSLGLGRWWPISGRRSFITVTPREELPRKLFSAKRPRRRQLTEKAQKKARKKAAKEAAPVAEADRKRARKQRKNKKRAAARKAARATARACWLLPSFVLFCLPAHVRACKGRLLRCVVVLLCFCGCLLVFCLLASFLPSSLPDFLPSLFSRKHGEGFFRWVHLSCSHESHYKVSLQGIIIMKVIARSHCKESWQGVIARSHCKESLQGVIARSHCKESWQGVIARSHCKESWQGLQLALDSLHLQLALDSLHLQLALDSMHLQLALDSMHLAPCTWLLALGSLHLAPCTCNLHFTPCTCDLHLTPCTWLLATCNGSHDSLQ